MSVSVSQQHMLCKYHVSFLFWLLNTCYKLVLRWSCEISIPVRTSTVVVGNKRSVKPKFHLARHILTQHNTFDVLSTSRRACQAVLFNKLHTAKLHGLGASIVSCWDVTWRAKWNLGLRYASMAHVRHLRQPRSQTGIFLSLPAASFESGLTFSRSSGNLNNSGISNSGGTKCRGKIVRFVLNLYFCESWWCNYFVNFLVSLPAGLGGPT